MGYNRNEERKRIYELLSESKIEEHRFTKKDLFDESINIAMSEYKELAQSYDSFFKSIDHLVIYQHALKGKVLHDTTNMLRDLRQLIEKNYEKEELERMPTPVYDQVLHTQKERNELLKQIAHTYLSAKVKK